MAKGTGGRQRAQPAPARSLSRGRKVQIIAGVGMVLAVIVAFVFSGPNKPGADDAAPTTTGVGGTAPDYRPIPTVPPGIPPAIVDAAVPKDQLGGLSFTDITAEAGIGLPQSDRAARVDSEFAGGASVVDYDGDGKPDIFLPRAGLPNALFHNDGDGTFTDRAKQAGLQGPDPAKGDSVGAWADVDGDGDPDVWLTSAQGAPNRLYLNQGDGTFVDATKAAGLATTPPADRIDSMYGSAFGDFDRDGDLDLLSLHYNSATLLESNIPTTAEKRPCAVAAERISHPTPAVKLSQSRLYVNDGKGHFTDGTKDLGLDLGPVIGFTPAWADYDDDGWPDLMITGDFCTSRVFHNDEGKGFTDVTKELGVGTDENGMGSAIEDVDGDGRLDWFVTAISYPAGQKGACEIDNSGCSGNRLWLNRADGTWEDATDRYGVRDGKWGWGAAAQDFDNDGDRDLLMVNGDRLGSRGPEGDPKRPYFDWFIENQTRLWLNPGKPPFVQAGTAVGLTGGGLAKSAIPFDLDGDGDLDLLISRTEGSLALFRNDLPATNGWLGVRLEDPASANHEGLGARVSVTVKAGGPTLVSEVRTEGTYGGSTLPVVHFGLGPGVTSVAEVEVRWPDGKRTTTLTNVEAGQVLEVTPP